MLNPRQRLQAVALRRQALLAQMGGGFTKTPHPDEPVGADQ